MKKKLALVCAMLHGPAPLILDEPTNWLDPFATRARHEIIRSNAAAGKTIFFSTHLLDQAEKLCTQIAIGVKGRLAAHGTLGELRACLTSDSSLEESFSRIEGFGRGPDRLPSTNEIIEIVDHPIPHFLSEVRVCSSMIEPNPVFN